MSFRSGWTWMETSYFSYSYNEKHAVKAADFCIFLNERDKKQAKQLYKNKEGYILPITFNDVYAEKKDITGTKSKTILLFVGSLFGPNISGIEWFVEEVMPELTECMLYIVGKNMESRKKELERVNVEVIGTVDNLSVYYNQANAVIMPVFFGNGMKVKTAEAMMYGKNIFATQEALEGYDIEGVRGRGIFECNTKEEFVSQIKANVNKNSHMNQRVRQHFLNKYETGAIEKDSGIFWADVLGKILRMQKLLSKTEIKMVIYSIKDFFCPDLCKGRLAILDIYLRIMCFLYPLYLGDAKIFVSFSEKEFLYYILTLLTALLYLFFSPTERKNSKKTAMSNRQHFVAFSGVVYNKRKYQDYFAGR